MKETLSINKQTIATSNFIGQKQLTKLKMAPLPALLDINLTRSYFTTATDGFARLFIKIIQIFSIGLIFFNGIGVGQLVANLPGIPAAPVFQRLILQVIAMLITIIFAIVILVMILPVFLSKTIKGIIATCLLFLLLGTIINLIIIGISSFMFCYSTSPYSMLVLILSIVEIIL